MPPSSAADKNQREIGIKISVSMYEKGRSFIMAGGLVKAYEGHEFVYLHLLCQGLECIGKALLLEHDYQKYKTKLRSAFGHDLEALISEVSIVSQTPLITNDALKELTQLNLFYKQHILRYGSITDIMEKPAQLSGDALHRDLVACLSALNEKFSAYGCHI